MKYLTNEKKGVYSISELFIFLFFMMKNLHQKALIALLIIFGGLFIRAKCQAFECYGYWSKGQCITTDGVWTFSTTKQCTTVDDWKEDTEGIARANNDLSRINDQIQDAERLLQDLQNKKNALYGKIANMPKVSYTRDACKTIEIPRFQYMPTEIMKVGADITYNW